MSDSEVVVKKPATPSIDEVRRILNEWSSKGYLRVRKLGDRLHIEEIRTLSSYTVHLRNQYEHRSIGKATRPYHGGSVDDHGVPPGAWDIDVCRPDDFEERTEKVPVPHTESVHPCTGCHGSGKVNCGPCQGWGKVNCTFCNGRGYRERTEFRNTPGPDGQTQTQTVTVRDNCTCSGGKVNCTHCAGHGKVQCSTCAGSGSVINSDLLTVQFRSAELHEVINTSHVPEHLVKGAPGVRLVTERAERIDRAPAVLDEVDQVTSDLLQKSHREAQGETRLLFQRLRVEQVGVHEVHYRHGGGQSRRLWIYGEVDSVHAPGAPRAWMRLLAVLGIGAAVIALVVYLLLKFVLRH
jgi:hypothetical protein